MKVADILELAREIYDDFPNHHHRMGLRVTPSELEELKAYIATHQRLTSFEAEVEPTSIKLYNVLVYGDLPEPRCARCMGTGRDLVVVDRLFQRVPCTACNGTGTCARRAPDTGAGNDVA